DREVIGVAQEAVEDDLADARERLFTKRQGPERPDELREALQEAETLGCLLGRFHELADDTPLSGEDACGILSAVADQTANVDAEEFSMPEVVPDEVTGDRFPDWAAGRVSQGI